MNRRIAIIDFHNHDVGLKILFKDSDYFILEQELDRTKINMKYNIRPIIHKKNTNVFDTVNSDYYDTLLIIAPLYDSLKEYNGIIKDSYAEKTYQYLLDTIELINKNNFKNIVFFDNYDYDYDPNIAFNSDFIVSHNIKFFKRYFNKEKTYKSNVYPFPYIIFGHQCNIDMVTDLFNKPIQSDKISRIFFSGSMINHIDNVYGIVRSRIEIMNKIRTKLQIYNPGHIPHAQFINEMSTSKYCLDLLGVGDPNIRTFEILSSGSLRLGQRSNLKWNFDDNFCEETIFDDENDLFEKLVKLENEPGLYEKCLNKQNEIVRINMNIDLLGRYIFDKLLQ
jgi:hypothetical protein